MSEYLEVEQEIRKIDNELARRGGARDSEVPILRDRRARLARRLVVLEGREPEGKAPTGQTVNAADPAVQRSEKSEWLALFREEQRIDREIVDLEEKLRSAPDREKWQGADLLDKKLAPAVLALKRESDGIKKEIRFRRQAKKQIAKRRVELEETDKVKPIVWLGTDREFADAVFKLFQKHLVLGRSWPDALRMAAEHFVDTEGNRFNPESIRENIRNRQKEGKGGPGEGLKLDE